MNRYKKSKLVMTISVLLAFSLSLLFLTAYQGIKIPYVTEGVTQVFSFVNSVFAKPVQLLSQEKEELLGLLEAYKENKELKGTIIKFEELTAEYETLKAENASLRQAVGLPSSEEGRLELPAAVTVRTPDAWNQKIVLGIGQNTGVSKDMFVVANGGLVGVVDEVEDSATTVRLLTNSDDFSKIAVKIMSGSESIYGILTGYDVDSHSFIISQLNSNVEVKSGSTVVTSDLAGNHPSNISVGKVTTVKNSSSSLNRELFVKPTANFSNIYAVTVIGKE